MTHLEGTATVVSLCVRGSKKNSFFVVVKTPVGASALSLFLGRAFPFFGRFRQVPQLQVPAEVLFRQPHREGAVASGDLSGPRSDRPALVVVPDLAGSRDELSSAEMHGLPVRDGVLLRSPPGVLGRRPED